MAGINHVLAAIREFGHCCLTESQITAQVNGLLGFYSATSIRDSYVGRKVYFCIYQGITVRRVAGRIQLEAAAGRRAMCWGCRTEAVMLRLPCRMDGGAIFFYSGGNRSTRKRLIAISYPCTRGSGCPRRLIAGNGMSVVLWFRSRYVSSDMSEKRVFVFGAAGWTCL